jgi:hypothetical protein
LQITAAGNALRQPAFGTALRGVAHSRDTSLKYFAGAKDGSTTLANTNRCAVSAAFSSKGLIKSKK